MTIPPESELGILYTLLLGLFILGVLFSWRGIIAASAPQIARWKEYGIVENELNSKQL